ncbi:hypothetical protein BSKO_08969 [Bryopsis sp. KO-2023]|nr:hypothetical protein BSKO_08969 [Bryopsis sp. KO-2023]
MSSGMENLCAHSVTVAFEVLLGCERMMLFCVADQSVEVIYLRRRLKALRRDFKELQGAFVALRQRGNGAHARVESFLYRMQPTPSRRPKPTPPSRFVRWLRAICCLPPLPEEEEVWQGEGSWLLGVEAQSLLAPLQSRACDSTYKLAIPASKSRLRCDLEALDGALGL